jgi:hypothetical protein
VRTGSSSHDAHPLCVLPIAHGWRTDDSAECSCQALAFDRDDSGNCTPQPARPPSLQRREAACAIASECPLLYSCGHSSAKYSQKIGTAEPLEIKHLRNK